MKDIKPESKGGVNFNSIELKFLQPEQLVMIEDALVGIGDYGEVRLVVEKGRLRFLVVEKSRDMLKECTAKMVKYEKLVV